ncbi:Fc.00g048180.m01.CDS01 [Cosmosporella sp. VM-42]
MRFGPTIASVAYLARLSISARTQDSKCVEHRSFADKFVDGPAGMSADPLVPFDSPMVSVFNSTISENWSFDAVSHDGKASIVVYVTRGAVADKVGAQRGLISVSWANGTRYMENAFLDMSTLTTCPKDTSGLWTNKAGDIAWSFTASTDFKEFAFTIKSPTINGTFKLKNRGPPIYPGGLIYPNAKASVMLAPEMYWQEQFPVAEAEVDLVIRGTPFILSGVGGRDKNWNSRPWAVISGNWDMGRTIVGPYGLMFWNYTSAVDGQSYFSATLMKGKDVVFRTSNGQPSCSETYGIVKLTKGGPVHLSSAPGAGSPLPKSRHTGYLIDLMSPKTGEHWRFALDFSQTTFWFAASESLNVGQFAGKVSGGLVNGKKFTGVASGSVQEYIL